MRELIISAHTYQINLVINILRKKLLRIRPLTSKRQCCEVIHVESCEGNMASNRTSTEASAGAVEHTAYLVVLFLALQVRVLSYILIKYLYSYNQ